MNKDVVKELKKRYPKGTRIELIHMDDAQAPPYGTEGTVSHVDDIGSIHVDWDNGSGLAVIPFKDVFKKVRL